MSEKTVKKNRKTILFGAALNTGNMGVSALSASLINLISKIRPDSSINLFIGAPESKVETLELESRTVVINIENYRLSPKARFHEHLLVILFFAILYRIIPIASLRKWILKKNSALRLLHDADFIGDICGGDSFSDIYGLRRFVVAMIPDLITLIMGKPLTLLPQTYGPFSSNIARFLGSFVIRHSASVFARDRESLAKAELFRKEADVHLTPDVAFTLPTAISEYIDISPPLKPFSENRKPLIGLNISGLLYTGGYTGDNMFNLKVDYKTFINNLIQKLLTTSDSDLILVPHTYTVRNSSEGDMPACREVYDSFKNEFPDRIHLLQQECDQHTVKTVIGRCDFFAGARMHSCIAALSQGIPTVGLAYSKKFRGVFNSIGMDEHVIDLRKTNTEAAESQLIDLFLKKDQTKPIVRQNAKQAQQRVRNTFTRLLSSSPAFSSQQTTSEPILQN